MHIGSRIDRVVFDFYRITAAVSPALEDDRAVADCLDRRARRSRVIHAVMGAIAFQDRMEARIGEAGRDAVIIQRSLEESLAKTVSLGVEELMHTVLREREGLIGLALVREDSPLDGGNAERRRIVDIRLVIDNLERIPFFDIEKVDLPSINIRDTDGEERVGPLLGDDVPERRRNRTLDVATLQGNGFVVSISLDRPLRQVDDRIIRQRFGKADVANRLQGILRRERTIIHPGAEFGRVEHAACRPHNAIRLQRRETEARKDNRRVVARFDFEVADIQRIDADAILINMRNRINWFLFRRFCLLMLARENREASQEQEKDWDMSVHL